MLQAEVAVVAQEVVDLVIEAEEAEAEDSVIEVEEVVEEDSEIEVEEEVAEVPQEAVEEVPEAAEEASVPVPRSWFNHTKDSKECTFLEARTTLW